MMCNLRKLTYDERLNKLDLMTTEERRRRGDMITTYKILQGKIDLGRNILEINTDSRTRGQQETTRQRNTKRLQKEFLHKKSAKGME